MKELKEAIMQDGIAIGNDIVKVDMFLNHRIDTGLMFRMGEELAKRFAGEKPDLILTVEASGIALALTTAHAMGDVPVLFAKKAATVVQSPDVAQASVYSFTHKRENIIRADKKYLPQGSRVLIVDDFLSDGQRPDGLPGDRHRHRHRKGLHARRKEHPRHGYQHPVFGSRNRHRGRQDPPGGRLTRYIITIQPHLEEENLT